MTIRRPFDALGSGQVESHADRPLIHFGSPGPEIEHAIRLARLRTAGFETTERMPR